MPKNFALTDPRSKTPVFSDYCRTSVRRGEISFREKVSNAARAGAAGVLIYNNRGGELRGSLGVRSETPAVALAQEEGERLLVLLSKGTTVVRVAVEAELVYKVSEDVVGTWRNVGSKVVVMGAHYDSVEVSPGANDNASGVGTIIELARVMSSISYPFEVRFIAFGAEELGLIGSRRYVESLDDEERQRILTVINFDMVGVGDSLMFAGEAGLVSDAKGAARGVNSRPV